MIPQRQPTVPQQSRRATMTSQVQELKEEKFKSYCCFVIPLRISIYLIGIFTILLTVKELWNIFWQLYFDNFIFTIIYTACTLPMVLASFLFFQFFFDEDQDSRDNLEGACKYVIFSQFTSSSFALVQMYAT